MKSADLSDKRCAVCSKPISKSERHSELFRGQICEDCYRIELEGWRKFGLGSLLILFVWFSVRVLYWEGVVGPSLSEFFSLAWGSVWFGFCLLSTYHRLYKRKQMISTSHHERSDGEGQAQKGRP
jgi:hypothetical protein